MVEISTEITGSWLLGAIPAITAPPHCITSPLTALSHPGPKMPTHLQGEWW